jgi:hypothetical protein
MRENSTIVIKNHKDLEVYKMAFDSVTIIFELSKIATIRYIHLLEKSVRRLNLTLEKQTR